MNFAFDNINKVKKNATKGGEKMSYIYNYNKLKGRITEKIGNQTNFAQKMKLSETTIYSKLNGKIEFKQSEILDACKILDISDYEITKYFFCINS